MKPEQKGVYSKLKDYSVSWSEKLSLARSAWDSPDCVIPNKQQVLLDWIAHELISGSKKAANSQFSEEVCGLWKLLLHVCQSQQLVSQGRIPVTLKPQLLQVFTDAFSHACEESASVKESSMDVVISSCYAVVSAPQLASSLLAKFESFVAFLSSLLSYFVLICLDQPNEDLYLLVEVCLEKYLLVQRQQANQRKVFTAMCQQLLEPLISLHHFLSAVQDQDRPNRWRTDKARDIFQLIKLALARSLFHKDHISEYQQALKIAREETRAQYDEPVIKKPRISTYTKLLFDKLREMSSDSVTTVKDPGDKKIISKKAALDILPFLYEEFVSLSRKLNPSISAVDFDFFTEVCEMLGILNGTCKDVSSACTLLRQLLECLHRYDIYQVADDSSNGSPQFSCLKNLVDVLIDSGEPGSDSEALFQCLDLFIKLNHSLLEPHLEIIWTMLWKAEKSDGAAYNSLLSSLISTYVKLRQFEKLVLAILVSLRNLGLSTCNFTARFQERFTKAIQVLPFGQIATIWNIFCEEIKESYLNKLHSLREHVLVKKPLKQKSSSHTAAVWRKLEYVLSVFHAFLLNISFGGIGEQLKRKPSLQSAELLLCNTVKNVLEPLMNLAYREIPPKERESACFSTILLQYTLGELEIFLSKFELFTDDERSETLLPSVIWSAEIGDFVPVKAKETSIISRDRGRLCYLKNALCIQSIRFTLLRKTELAQEPELFAEFQRLVSCVCSSIGDKALGSSSWDTQVLTISEKNAPVALWDLISKNAVILLPPCNADQQLTLAQLLIKTLAEGNQANRQATPGFVTMSDVSEAMIQSTAFHEMLAMQTRTVCALWRELQQSIDSTCSADNLGGRLSKLLYKIAAPQLSRPENQNEGRVCRDTAKDDDHMIGGEENDSVGDDENAEGSSDDDSNGEDDFATEEETSEEQYTGGLNAFHAIGCELTAISKSVLVSKEHFANLSAAECHRLLKVLGYLPLDWLSDDNHSCCLIGLFTCDVLFNSALLKECSPDLLKPLLLSRQLLTTMFDGCVSRKRFLPHHVIDLESLYAWLISSSTKLWQTFYTDPTLSRAIGALLGVTRSLLYSTVKYLLKAPSNSTSNEHSSIKKLQDDLQTISKEVLQNAKHSLKKTLCSHHAVSIIIEGILAVCEEVVTSKTSSTKMIRISSDIVIKLGPSLLKLLNSATQASQKTQKGNKDKNTKDGSESNWHDILLQFPVLIDSLTSVLHIFSVSEQSRKLQRVNEALKKYEWQSVFDVVLAAVIHNLFERNTTLVFSVNEAGTLHSSLRFLKIVCQSCSKLAMHLPDDFHFRLLASVLHFLRLLEQNKSKSTEAPKTDELQPEKEDNAYKTAMMDKQNDSENEDIAEEGYNLVVSLIEGCDLVLLSELLEGMCGEITTKTIKKEYLERLFVSLQVWLRLLSGRFTKDRRKELRPKLPKVLFALQFLLQELKACNLRIVHLSIDVMVKILSLGKEMLLPHNALLVLHSGLMIKLESCGNSFPQLFESQYTLLSTLLFQHSEAVYGAVHVFITCVRNLLWSLIQSCDERKEAITVKGGSQKKASILKPFELTQSAQRMARLYQEISSHKSTFSKYSPYMIADYIHSVQSVAIPLVIREALVPGVYCLLDMCGEHELSLMHAVLEKGARELFHSLHADYTKYHKFKGKV